MEIFEFEDDRQAETNGFASFNKCPTVGIAVPNGVTTYSFLTSEGKRLTVSFLPYENGGAPQCADIAYHDSGQTVMTKSGQPMPAMHAILWTGEREHDTRQHKPVAFATVLMDAKSYKSA